MGIQDLSSTEFGNSASSNPFLHATSESMDETSTDHSSPRSFLPTPPSPATGYAIDWYDNETGPSDEVMLEEFFLKNPRLDAQVSRMKTHKRKRQSDAELILDYKFALEIYNLLKERKWGVRLICIWIHYVAQHLVGRMATTSLVERSSGTLGLAPLGCRGLEGLWNCLKKLDQVPQTRTLLFWNAFRLE